MRNLSALLLALLIGSWAWAQTAVPPAPPPTPAATPENTLYLDLSTGGKVAIQLRPDVAPGHVARIKTLVRRGFYDGIVFHRVIDGFMAQTGDPKGTGEGGSDLPDLKAEFNGMPHVRGAVSMARTDDPNSANSQFFITFAPRMSLDGKYTVFGRVIGGMAFVDAIKRGEGDNGRVESEPSRIVKATIAADVLGATPAVSVVPAVPSVRTPPPALVSQPASPATARPAVAAPKKVRNRR
jgi:peptidylprolyl isomerase